MQHTRRVYDHSSLTTDSFALLFQEKALINFSLISSGTWITIVKG